MTLHTATRIYIAGCGGMLGRAFHEEFSGFADLTCTDIDVNEEWVDYLDFRDSNHIDETRTGSSRTTCSISVLSPILSTVRLTRTMPTLRTRWRWRMPSTSPTNRTSRCCISERRASSTAVKRSTTTGTLPTRWVSTRARSGRESNS